MTKPPAQEAHAHTQDAYERLLPQLVTLASEGRYDEALAALAELLDRHDAEDDDGWLRRSVSAHRALLLLEMGQWEAALVEYEVHAQLSSSDPSDHIESALGRATCLSELGRQAEAIAVIEDGLARLPASHMGSALGLLFRLAQACHALGQSVPARHAQLVQRIAATQQIMIPDGTLADPTRLGEVIMAIHRQVVLGQS